jgi:hypothetical protein
MCLRFGGYSFLLYTGSRIDSRGATSGRAAIRICKQPLLMVNLDSSVLRCPNLTVKQRLVAMPQYTHMQSASSKRLSRQQFVSHVRKEECPAGTGVSVDAIYNSGAIPLLKSFAL